MPDTAITTETTPLFPLSDLIVAQADGFVVVSRWVTARHRVNSFTYDHYDHLKDAAEVFGELEAGLHHNFAAIGIFPAKDGLPIGGPLSAEAIALAVRT